MGTEKEQRNVNIDESKQGDYVKKNKGKFPWFLTGSIFIGCFAFSLISASILAGVQIKHLPLFEIIGRRLCLFSFDLRN